jgi:nucleoid-associated protein YgaU
MVWLFTEVADGFDKLVHDDEVFLEDWGTRVAGDYVRDGGVVNVLELAGVSLTNAGFKLSTTVAKGFVDVLRLGDGVKKGGWGYGQDALRALIVAGPAFRVARNAAALVAEVDFNAYLGNCAWVAGAQSLRFSGTRLFASVGDLARWAGLTAGETGGVRSAADLAPMLRLLGAGVRTVAPEGKAAITTMDEVFQAARTNRDGVLMFGIKWLRNGEPVGHALIARWTPLGVRIIDRSTNVVRSLGELEKLVPAYKGISTAVPAGEALFVENSIAVKTLANVPSLLNTLAVEVKPVIYRESKLAGVARVVNGASPPPKPDVHLGTFNTTVVCHAPNSDQLPQCRTYYSYTVGQGESLSSIARRVYRDQGKWSTIYAANRALIGSNPNLIRPGMQLVLPSNKGPTLSPPR